MDEDFDYDDFMDMMEEDEISYRDEYRNQTAFLNEEDYDHDDEHYGDEDAFTD